MLEKTSEKAKQGLKSIMGVTLSKTRGESKALPQLSVWEFTATESLLNLSLLPLSHLNDACIQN